MTDLLVSRYGIEFVPDLLCVCVCVCVSRMLEQLRKQQGSVLHPNYSVPFNSFDDTLQRLLPYHLYQGTANSSQDYKRGRPTARSAHWDEGGGRGESPYPQCLSPYQYQ